MTEGLHLDALTITLGTRRLIALDRTIAPGEILTVMGPSGSGKSSLLSALIGTLAPAFTVSGRVVLDGIDITRAATHHRRIGILFQDDLLFPHLSVGDNLAFALPPSCRGRAARRARIESALADVDLSGFADRDPATLSGGQKARVSLMRMLLAEPRALLLDEPFSSLDRTLRTHVRTLVFDRARQHRLPVLLVTHDREDAMAAGGGVIQLSPDIAV